MDNELTDIRIKIDSIVRLKLDSKILRGLVDTILDNTALGYDDNSLRLTNESEILTVIKTFYLEEYNNRLNDLKADKQAKRERLKSKGKDSEVD